MKKLNLIIIFLFAGFLIQCSSEKKDKRDKDTKKCLSDYAILATAQSGILPKGTYSFQYSCSTIGAYDISCYEIFSTSKYDGLCNVGYEKVKARCSQQNLIGVCRYVSKETNQAVTAVFSKPTDTEENAKAYCISPQINGIFTTSYKEPTSSVDSIDQALIGLYNCYSKID